MGLCHPLPAKGHALRISALGQQEAAKRQGGRWSRKTQSGSHGDRLLEDGDGFFLNSTCAVAALARDQLSPALDEEVDDVLRRRKTVDEGECVLRVGPALPDRGTSGQWLWPQTPGQAGLIPRGPGQVDRLLKGRVRLGRTATLHQGFSPRDEAAGIALVGVRRQVSALRKYRSAEVTS